MTTNDTAPTAAPVATPRPEDIPTAFDATLNRADLDALMRLFHPRAIMRMADGTVVADGPDALRAALARLLDTRPHLHNTVRRVLASDDLALIMLDWEIHQTIPGAGETTQRGTATNVAGRGDDGNWLLRIANPLGIQ